MARKVLATVFSSSATRHIRLFRRRRGNMMTKWKDLRYGSEDEYEDNETNDKDATSEDSRGMSRTASDGGASYRDTGSEQADIPEYCNELVRLELSRPLTSLAGGGCDVCHINDESIDRWTTMGILRAEASAGRECCSMILDAILTWHDNADLSKVSQSWIFMDTAEVRIWGGYLYSCTEAVVELPNSFIDLRGSCKYSDDERAGSEEQRQVTRLALCVPKGTIA